ncbi:hypothetical protein N7541_000118 [Penicillium brevicompactum]|uniref:Uncharacterized protein n=1 Tax=Penicillium brevicompactum TaxID=5074 RepID=A0A9W9V296_PENBR|nr:hypothetical protein N7541_000118 [Penicillium brevicompactum]
MDIFFESMPPRQINVHVDKQERRWTTFSFDVRSGPRTGRKCCNVPTLTGVIYPSSWVENRPPMTRSERPTWMQCEPQSDLPSLRADLRPPNPIDERTKYPLLLTPTPWTCYEIGN